MSENDQVQLDEILKLLQNRNTPSTSAAPDEFQKMASIIFQIKDTLTDKEKDTDKGVFYQNVIAFIGVVIVLVGGWIGFYSQVSKLEYRVTQLEESIKEHNTEFKKMESEVYYGQKNKYDGATNELTFRINELNKKVEALYNRANK